MKRIVDINKDIDQKAATELQEVLFRLKATALVRIVSINSYYLGETKCEPGFVKLGGHEINTETFAYSFFNSYPLGGYSPVETESECNEILLKVVPGSFWLTSGELCISYSDNGTPEIRLMGADYNPLPERFSPDSNSIIREFLLGALPNGDH